MKYQQIIYYKDELRDDFGTSVKRIKPLPKSYKYVPKNIFFRGFSAFVYWGLVKPLAWLYMKIKFHHRIKNNSVVKPLKTGYFIYGNHTTIIGDALMPNIVSFKTKNFIITGEQTNSLTPILPLLNAIGALPLTDNLNEKKELIKAIKTRIQQKASITIYPEAHVWAYYTDIRPYTAESFKYAVKLNVPVVCMTNCFQKRRFRKRPKIVTYIDGPFFPEEGLSPNENAQRLRDVVYQKMKERTKEYSTYSYFQYKRKED